MKFNRTLIVGLAILMVLLSGCLVFAEDTNGTDDGLLDNETDVNKLVKQVEEKIVKSIRNRVVVSV